MAIEKLYDYVDRWNVEQIYDKLVFCFDLISFYL